MDNVGADQIAKLGKDDVVICLMGITGSGKSTFISLLSDDFVQVGHELTSCTADIEIYSYIHRNTRRVFLIDTPGFDDTSRTDTDVLKQLAFWLGNAYKKDLFVSIVYLHRVTDDRMSGSSLKNLNMFKKLCGEEAYRHICLATTMWSNLNGPNLSYDTGVAREKELLSRKDWWGLMNDRGSFVVRHDGSKDCAMKIIDNLIERRAQGPVTLNIQKEMIDDKKSLEDTAAGQEVEKEITLAKKKFQEQISELQESYDDALKERDEQLAQVLKDQSDELEKKLQRAGEAQENLKISFEKLCEQKTAEYAQMVHELQEEKRQRIADRQSELDRVQEEHERITEQHRKQVEVYEKQREEAEQRMQDLLKAHKTTEAERARDEKEKLDRMQRQMEERFNFEKQQQQQHAQAIQAQMIQLQQAQPSKKESSLMPLISLFAGVATSGIGLLTLNPNAVLSGIGTALDGLSGAGSN